MWGFGARTQVGRSGQRAPRKRGQWAAGRAAAFPGAARQRPLTSRAPPRTTRVRGAAHHSSGSPAGRLGTRSRALQGSRPCTGPRPSGRAAACACRADAVAHAPASTAHATRGGGRAQLGRPRRFSGPLTGTLLRQGEQSASAGSPLASDDSAAELRERTVPLAAESADPDGLYVPRLSTGRAGRAITTVEQHLELNGPVDARSV